jgi:anti-sigma regulatory factor (Ser/Thr protein kinase)
LRTEISLRISGDLAELKNVREAVRAFLDSTKHIDIGEDRAAGLDAIQQSRIILAIDEAVANIVEHGFESPKELANAQISLTMRKEPQRVEFEIRDNGMQFNPLEHKSDTEFYYEEGLEDGMGLIALTTLDCAYERQGETNVLILKREWGSSK